MLNAKEKDSLDIIKENYIEFSKYTMAHRTYPCVYDGLKEVQRRCLYASFKDAPASMIKLSTLAGLVMGYHPHAEASDVIIKLGGEYQSPFPLYDTQGNWGDEENPASAPRYLECKLNDVAKKLYFSLINEAPMENFEVKNEPLYLPTLFPVALLQSSYGVGQGTPNVLIPSLNFETFRKFIINYIKTGEKTVSSKNMVKFTDYNQIKKEDRDSSIREVLNTGKGTIIYSPDIEYKDNKITITNLYVLAQFPSLMEKLKSDIQADKIDVRDESGIDKVWVIEKVKNKVFDMDACVKMIKQRFTFKENYCMYFYDEKGNVKLYSLGEIVELCFNKYREAYINKINKEIDSSCEQKMILECLWQMSDNVDIITDRTLSKEDKIQKLVEVTKYNKDIVEKAFVKPLHMLQKDEASISKFKTEIQLLQDKLSNINEVIIKELKELNV